MKLTEEERKQLRQTIIDDLMGNEGSEKTPVDKIKQRIEVYIEQEIGDKDQMPTIPLEDLNEEDVGEFPDTVH